MAGAEDVDVTVIASVEIEEVGSIVCADEELVKDTICELVDGSTELVEGSADGVTVTVWATIDEDGSWGTVIVLTAAVSTELDELTEELEEEDAGVTVVVTTDTVSVALEEEGSAA